MSNEKDNLAAGRLGTPRPGSPAGKRAKTNYGFGRLGITPEESKTPEAAPAPAKSGKDEPAPAPARRRSQTVSRAEVARILVPDPAGPTGGPSSRRNQGGYSEDPHFGPTTPEADKGRKRALAVAVAGGVLVVLLIVAFWKSRGSTPAPARGDAPAPPVTTAVPPVPPPPVHPTGPDTRHLAARPRREPRGTWTPPKDDGGAPWMPPVPDRPSNAGRIPDRFRRPPAPTDFVAPPAARPQPARPTPAPPAAASPPPASQPAIVTPTGIEVTAIMRGFGAPSAIINNHHVKVGETIKGAKLLRIGEFAVEVEFQGKTFEIGVTSAASAPLPSEEDDDGEERPEE